MVFTIAEYVLAIEVFAIILLIYGLNVFFNAAKGTNYGIRIGFFLIIASLGLQIVQGMAVEMLLFNRIEANNLLWMLYPLIGLLGAFLVTLGAKRILKGLN